MVDIPKNITDFNDKLNYVLHQFDIEYRKVDLDGSFTSEPGSPLLIFTILNNIPVILFPRGDKYYYINYQTGKKVYVKADNVNRLEMEAYSFYRPLPNKKVSIKEYAKYISKSVRPLDIVLLVLFTAIASGVGLLLPYLTRMLTGNVANSNNYNQLILVSIYVVATATGLILVNISYI